MFGKQLQRDSTGTLVGTTPAPIARARRYATVAGLAVTGVLIATMTGFGTANAATGAAAHPGAKGAARHGIHVFGWGFGYPYGVASDGTHVWVTNLYGGSVTELDAATGALVHVLQGPKYGFDDPAAISSDGSHVWVTNIG